MQKSHIYVPNYIVDKCFSSPGTATFCRFQHTVPFSISRPSLTVRLTGWRLCLIHTGRAVLRAVSEIVFFQAENYYSSPPPSTNGIHLRHRHRTGGPIFKREDCNGPPVPV